MKQGKAQSLSNSFKQLPAACCMINFLMAANRLGVDIVGEYLNQESQSLH